MMVSKRYFLLCFIHWVCSGVSAIQINYIKVPLAVQNDSKHPTVIDCDYDLRPDDTDLVVKWYLNDVFVYQWNPPQRPQSFGPLKDRLDLEYKATQDPDSVYRAMKIRNPTDDIAGEYKCFVSTFTDEDFLVRNMRVFVPEKALVVFKSSFDEDYTNFTCLVSEVFPSPKLHIYKTFENEFDRHRIQTVHREVTKHNTKLFSSYIVASTATETLNPGSLILCEIRIPSTGYVRIESLLYYPEAIKENIGNKLKISTILKSFFRLLHIFHSFKILNYYFI